MCDVTSACWSGFQAVRRRVWFWSCSSECPVNSQKSSCASSYLCRRPLAVSRRKSTGVCTAHPLRCVKGRRRSSCTTPVYHPPPSTEGRAKYHSGTGWPSFTESVSPDAVELVEDRSHGMVRTEVRCALPFPPWPRFRRRSEGGWGQRWCMNSVALDLEQR